ncbi:hypothetical protein FGU65_14185 [Methanoculleus sp. FWC-SCC1]|uniref:Uncharacterized protein n=1 Tax=Methanoculleus frigidifontis TaxID=2584085 RepID=A0ABT8MDJ4_9EURY|nr:hypothetical protein [Methanoculleus sp. FWC-SCC1]MDN7026018.1 hypothetical protein [Methanoculleus sp. FWC-SCC1]
MIINNRKRMIVTLGVIISGVLIAFLFINLFQVYWFMSAPYEVKLVIDLVCGLFMAISLGMLFSADSRYNGILFGLLFGAIIWHFLPYECIVMEALGLGFVLGIVIVGYVLFKNRFDVLATSAKALLTIACVVILGYLLTSFMTVTSSMTVGTAVDVSKISAQNTFFYGGGVLITILFYAVLMYSIVGVKGSSVFILGPRSSGKTYLLLGLWAQMTKKSNAFPHDVIISSDPDDRKHLRLTDLYAGVTGGRGLWKRTENYQLSLYQIIAKKFRVSPVTWTILDYAGEYYDKIDADTYKTSLEALNEAFEIPIDDLAKRSGTPEFLEEVNEQHLDKLYGTGLARDLVLSTMYSHLARSGKVIFLIDGEKMLTREGMADLSREFGDYIKTLMDLEGGVWFKIFGGKKKYALVITKLDILLNKHPDLRRLVEKMDGVNNLSDIPENSPEAELIEKTLFKSLEKNLSFLSLVNMLNDISLSFYAVSADATAEPNPLAADEQAPSQLVPWRFGEVVSFGS